MSEPDVPTPPAMWDFLVGLSETTQKSFQRIESRFDAMDSRFDAMESRFSELQSQFALMQVTMLNIERRVVRIDDRLSVVEDLNIRSRLDDHEGRITRLEGKDTSSRD